MRFENPPLSDHPLVELRPIEARDLASWFAYLTLPAVQEHTSWSLASPSDLTHFVGSSESGAPDGNARFAIALRDGGELVGTAGFQAVSARHHSAELAYDLAPPFWGRGLASWVARSLTAWARREANVVRVQAVVLDSNLRSIAVLERAGFEREGLLKSYRFVRGTPRDFWMYASTQRPRRD
ncbi:MAG: GNAT family protein [Polyangiaceae bacterium]